MAQKSGQCPSNASQKASSGTLLADEQILMMKNHTEVKIPHFQMIEHEIYHNV